MLHNFCMLLLAKFLSTFLVHLQEISDGKGIPNFIPSFFFLNQVSEFVNCTLSKTLIFITLDEVASFSDHPNVHRIACIMIEVVESVLRPCRCWFGKYTKRLLVVCTVAAITRPHLCDQGQ